MISSCMPGVLPLTSLLHLFVQVIKPHHIAKLILLGALNSGCLSCCATLIQTILQG